MGFELGPKPLRRPPTGWLPARAFPLRHRAGDHPNAEPGETEIDTSFALDVLWRIETAGRPPYELEEQRKGPMWLRSGALGPGNRWYKVRLGAHYGLMEDVGVPGFVDPGDPSKLWIDWDRAYTEHTEAWDREARVRRAVSEHTEHRVDSALHRLGNPFARKARPEDQPLVDERLAQHHAREAAEQAQWAEHRRRQADLGHRAADADEPAELTRRMRELERIHEVGRKTKATVIACENTGRTFAGVPVFVITFEIDGRRVVFEHMYGPRLIKRYQKPGAKVDVWVDPEDPDAIVPN